MSVKKKQLSITFTDGTTGTITAETIKGRVDVKAEYEDVRIYYYTEKVGKSWLVNRCNDGCCYDTIIIAETATRKEAIAEIILDVRKNQVRTAYTYILETSSGRMFEVVATSECLAKKCVRFECAISEDKLHTKEIKKVDAAKQHKAKIGGFADFINETLPSHLDEGHVENEESNSQTGKVYKSEEEAIADNEKNIADSVPIEETDSIELPVEDEKVVHALDKLYEIVANPLFDLNDVISKMKSLLNSDYGEHAVKQTIDDKNDMVRTELTVFHVSCVITETGINMLSCDIYAQDLDIKESYLAYNVGSVYAVYDEISLTRIEIFPSAESVKQFFVSRVEALETETIKRLY